MGAVIEVRGNEELARRLERAGRLEPVRDLVEQAAARARELAARYARPHPADTGALGRAVEVRIQGLEALVTPARRVAGIALTVEEGRQPGQRPPKAAITLWAGRHGIGVDPWVLASRIAREGTRGVRMFARAAEETEQWLRAQAGSVAARVERDLA